MSQSITITVKSTQNNTVVKPVTKTNQIVGKNKYSIYTDNKKGGYGYYYGRGGY